MQVEQFLELSAQRSPDKTALVCQERRLTYREIEEQSNKLAHALIENGVERGDRVAIYLDNSVEAVLSIFAVLKAGAVFLVVNPTTKPDKLAYILTNCRATALVTDARKLEGMGKLRGQVPDLGAVVVAGADALGLAKGGARLLSLEGVLED